MTPYRIVEVLLGLGALVGLVFSSYLFLDARHASHENIFQIKSELLDRDIKKDAEARVYYKNKESDAPLERADKLRLEYIEEQLERKYDEQKIIQKALLDK